MDEREQILCGIIVLLFAILIGVLVIYGNEESTNKEYLCRNLYVHTSNYKDCMTKDIHTIIQSVKTIDENLPCEK